MGAKIYKGDQALLAKYLNDELGIEIYEDLTENDEYKGLFEPLAFFELLYSEFEFFKTNASNYLEIKTHFGEIKFEDKKQYYFFWALNQLTDIEYSTDKYYKGIVVKSLQIIEGIRAAIEEKLYPSDESETSQPINKYDFEDVIKHTKTLTDNKEKIQFLIERKTDFLQNKPWDYFSIGTSFSEQCDLEINKLKELAKIEKTESITPIKLNSKNNNATFKLKDSVISKIDYIRIINAMCELRAFETQNGTIPTKKDVMQIFGNIVGVDLSNYDKDLNKAFTTTVSMEKNLEIFDKMKMKTQDIFLSKLIKPKK